MNSLEGDSFWIPGSGGSSMPRCYGRNPFARKVQNQKAVMTVPNVGKNNLAGVFSSNRDGTAAL
jgi:hypothetical protein